MAYQSLMDQSAFLPSCSESCPPCFLSCTASSTPAALTDRHFSHIWQLTINMWMWIGLVTVSSRRTCRILLSSNIRALSWDTIIYRSCLIGRTTNVKLTSTISPTWKLAGSCGQNLDSWCVILFLSIGWGPKPFIFKQPEIRNLVVRPMNEVVFL